MRCRALSEFVAFLLLNDPLVRADDLRWCVQWMEEGIERHGMEQIDRYRELPLESWSMLIALKPAWSVSDDTADAGGVNEPVLCEMT